jgi:hypothetical protein
MKKHVNVLWKVWKVWKLIFQIGDTRPERSYNTFIKAGCLPPDYPLRIRTLDFTMMDYSEKLAFMDLKTARAKGKLAEFIRQHERPHPHTRKYRFRAVVKSMALNKRKARGKG